MDLISRKAAIDAVNEYLRLSAMNKTVEGMTSIQEILEKLPSAQPEITLESAIDYLHSIGWMQNHDRILTESAQPEACAYWDREGNLCALHRPSAQPEQRWIPCSERLPDGIALCIDNRQHYLVAYAFADEESDTGFSAESDECYMHDCIAWMLMPKYKEEEA